MLMKKAMEQQVKTRLEVEMNTPVQNVPVTTPRTTGYECLWCEVNGKCFEIFLDDFYDCLYLCIMTRALLIKRGMVAREG